MYYFRNTNYIHIYTMNSFRLCSILLLNLFLHCTSFHANFGPPPRFPSREQHFGSSDPNPSGHDNSHCALLIPGPGKSSAFDHAADIFNNIHAPPHDEEGFTCITFKSVDAAFIEARDRYGLPRPQGDTNVGQLASLGNVLTETSKIIAKQYNLPKDVLVNGLPLINTLKTLIGSVCQDFLKPRECKIKRYRDYDGRCNNLDHPHWGSAFTTFKRRIPPDYADGISTPRISKDGFALPSPRAISAHVHRDEGRHDHAVTIMTVAWGQALDHDLTLTGETKLPGTREDPKCCERDQDFPECLPIRVSEKDPFFSLFRQKCISVTRSAPGVSYDCKLGPRTQINEITSYIDANWVYGSGKKTVDRIRLHRGGLLKSLPVFREFGLKDLLPLKLDEPEEGCIRPNDEVFCFDAGDGRVNEQLVLAAVHTLMMREHNRVAIELNHINPHWDDDKLFEESRQIIAAQVQHITYNEFLPMVLGKEIMQKHGLIIQKHGYFDGYNPKLDVTMSAEFVTAAFRFGHSLLPSTIERWSPAHKYIASQRLSEMLRQPYDLYKGGWCDQYIMGLTHQVAQAMDDSVTQEVTNHLFQEPNKRFGMDLAAINMQRAREHGVPSYNAFRHMCGLHTIHNWDQLQGLMPNKTVSRYAELYRDPDDLDLWSGGVSERPLPGSMVGPTFGCLIGITFKELRYGDRFWYENHGYPSSFLPDQLQEIRKIKLSRIICDNTDDIKSLQVYAMVLADHDINPLVPCASSILPHLDLTKWRDVHGPPPSFIKKPISLTKLEPSILPPGTKQHFRNPGVSEDSPPSSLSNKPTQLHSSRDPKALFQPTLSSPQSFVSLHKFTSHQTLPHNAPGHKIPHNSNALRNPSFTPFQLHPTPYFPSPTIHNDPHLKISSQTDESFGPPKHSSLLNDDLNSHSHTSSSIHSHSSPPPPPLLPIIRPLPTPLHTHQIYIPRHPPYRSQSPLGKLKPFQKKVKKVLDSLKLNW